jgi:hypothetical protein
LLLPVFLVLLRLKDGVGVVAEAEDGCEARHWCG